MYYKYKSRKRDYTLLKRIFSLMFFLISAYFAYSYRDVLMFWKIDQKELNRSIVKTVKIKDKVARGAALRQLESQVKTISSEKAFDKEVLSLSAMYNYEMFLHRWGSDFTSFYVGDSLGSPGRYEKNLQRVIKDIKKIQALNSSGGISDELRILLAKASFYLSFYEIPYLYEILSKVDREKASLSADDIRFISIIDIEAGNFEKGLKLLKSRGEVQGSILGQLFFSKALVAGKKYTEAIIVLKKALKEAKTRKNIILLRMFLGQIYFQQNLFKEATWQFHKVRELEEEKLAASIWLGKSLMKQGYEKKARKVWSQALTLHPGDRELLFLIKKRS